MPEKPVLYLHIGHQKAGSTTLQHFLYQNWPALHKAGYTLPTTNLMVCKASDTPGNPLETLQKLKRDKDTAPLRNWIEEASKTSEKLILSSECLTEWYWHKAFMDLQDLVDLHVIYYVRRQDEILLSYWRQWGLKRGLTLDAFIPDRIKADVPNYMSITAPWRNRVKPRYFHARFIDPASLHGHSIQSDFANQLGIQAPELEWVTNKNESLDARLLHFFAERPSYFSSIHDNEILNILSGPETDKLRPQLNEQQFNDIKAAFEESNQTFLKNYHAERAGTPVIARETAPIGPNHAISLSEQRAFIEKCLASLPADQNHRVLQLRKELGL